MEVLERLEERLALNQRISNLLVSLSDLKARKTALLEETGGFNERHVQPHYTQKQEHQRALEEQQRQRLLDSINHICSLFEVNIPFETALRLVGPLKQLDPGNAITLLLESRQKYLDTLPMTTIEDLCSNLTGPFKETVSLVQTASPLSTLPLSSFILSNLTNAMSQIEGLINGSSSTVQLALLWNHLVTADRALSSVHCSFLSLLNAAFCARALALIAKLLDGCMTTFTVRLRQEKEPLVPRLVSPEIEADDKGLMPPGSICKYPILVLLANNLASVTDAIRAFYIPPLQPSLPLLFKEKLSSFSSDDDCLQSEYHTLVSYYTDPNLWTKLIVK